MEGLWRWTSSVFLVLALTICCIDCQNARPGGALPQQVLQGEPSRECPGFANQQLQMNNLFPFPPNGLAPGGPTALDNQRPAFQDRICQQYPSNQQTNAVPQSTCGNLGPVNTQILQCSSCTDPSNPGFSNPGPLLPFPQPICPQNQCLFGPANTPPQQINMSPGQLSPLNQGMLLGPCPTATGPPLTKVRPAPITEVDICSESQQESLLRQQVNTSPCTSSVPIKCNHFTPLVPINPRLQSPCIDMPPPQGVTLPSTLPQSISQACPLNTHGCYVDVSLPVPSQYSSTLNSPLVNSLFPLPNRLPTQGPILPEPQINCLPQGSAFTSQCDIFPETEPCLATNAQSPSTIGPVAQNPSLFSPFNKFRFPKPTLFPPTGSLQGPMPLPCDFPPTNIPNQASVCANPVQNQQELIFAQVSTANFAPNTLPGLLNQNFQQFPLQPPCVYQTPLNSGPCSLSTDIKSIQNLYPPIISQSCAIPQNTFEAVLPNSVACQPIPTPNTSPTYFNGIPPPFPPIPFNEPSDNAGPLQPATVDSVPIPITLHINVEPPVIPAPTITLINATPATDTAVSTDNGESSFFELPYPMPHKIIEKRRSSSRSWLPLVLVALFANDGDFGGGCSCDSGPIPIPYPIPIPTNNPVIIN